MRKRTNRDKSSAQELWIVIFIIILEIPSLPKQYNGFTIIKMYAVMLT